MWPHQLPPRARVLPREKSSVSRGVAATAAASSSSPPAAGGTAGEGGDGGYGSSGDIKAAVATSTGGASASTAVSFDSRKQKQQQQQTTPSSTCGTGGDDTPGGQTATSGTKPPRSSSSAESTGATTGGDDARADDAASTIAEKMPTTRGGHHHRRRGGAHPDDGATADGGGATTTVDEGGGKSRATLRRRPPPQSSSSSPSSALSRAVEDVWRCCCNRQEKCGDEASVTTSVVDDSDARTKNDGGVSASGVVIAGGKIEGDTSSLAKSKLESSDDGKNEDENGNDTFVACASMASNRLEALRRAVEDYDRDDSSAMLPSYSERGAERDDEEEGGSGRKKPPMKKTTTMTTLVFPPPVMDCCDPTEIFLCVQGAALHFHHWYTERRKKGMISSATASTKLREEEDENEGQEEKDEERRGMGCERSDVINRSVHCRGSGRVRRSETSVEGDEHDDAGPSTPACSTVQSSGRRTGDEGKRKVVERVMPPSPSRLDAIPHDEWDKDLAEQEAWYRVWEGAMSTLAVLARRVVGPAWDRQSSSSTSTSRLGGEAAGASEAEHALAEYRSSLRRHPPVVVPEVLPASMIRFAASVCSLVLPPPPRRPDDDGALSGTAGSMTGRILHLERTWVLRRRELGRWQRDLVLALCCRRRRGVVGGTGAAVEAGKNRDCEEGGEGEGEGDRRDDYSPHSHFTNSHLWHGIPGECSDGDGVDLRPPQQRQPSSWKIPGARGPVAVMVRSWLDTARARWPVLLPQPPPSSSSSLPSSSNATADDGDDGGGDGHDDDDVNGDAGFGGGENTKGRSTTRVVVRSVAAERVDWSHARSVAGCVADLVSAGWRPPPSPPPPTRVGVDHHHGDDDEGEDKDDAVAFAIVSRLVSIAEDGLFCRARGFCDDIASIIGSRGGSEGGRHDRMEGADGGDVDDNDGNKNGGGEGEGDDGVNKHGSDPSNTLGRLRRRGEGRECPSALLASTSAAAESMRALASLVSSSSGGIASFLSYSGGGRRDVLECLVGGLCRILALAEVDDEDGDGDDTKEVGEDADEDKEEEGGGHDHRRVEGELIRERRGACLLDAAELLWTLLSSSSSSSSPSSSSSFRRRSSAEDDSCPASRTVRCLLRTMANDAAATSSAADREGDGANAGGIVAPSALAATVGAVRTLSAALWGNPPSFGGVSSLRAYWCPVLERMTKMSLAFCHPEGGATSCPSPSSTAAPDSTEDEKVDAAINTTPRVRITANATDEYDFPILRLHHREDDPSLHYSTWSLRVILEVSVALRRLVDGELGGSGGGGKDGEGRNEMGIDDDIDGDDRAPSCRGDGVVLSRVEWDTLIDLLRSIAPWLSCRRRHGLSGPRPASSGSSQNDNDVSSANLSNEGNNIGDDKNVNESIVVAEKERNEIVSKKKGRLIRRIIREIDLVLAGIQKFLESSPPGRIIDDECRRRLYAVLLRRVCPLLTPAWTVLDVDTVDDEESHEGCSSREKRQQGDERAGRREDMDVPTMLGLSVIHSWAIHGCPPPSHGGKKLCLAAFRLLADAFAVYEDESIGYCCGHVHPPCVRLEALRVICWDSSEEVISSSDTWCRKFDIRTRTRQRRTMLSPLVLSRHVPEVHAELINLHLLPVLASILTGTFRNDAIGSTVDDNAVDETKSPDKALQAPPCPNIVKVPVPRSVVGKGGKPRKARSPPRKLVRDEQALEQFAVQLLDVLFRSESGSGDNRQDRSLIVRLLRGVALHDPSRIAIVGGETRDTTFVGSRPTVESRRSTDYRDVTRAEVRFSAIHQMDRCLRAAFTDRPHVHEHIPTVLDAMCDVVRTYSSLAKIEMNGMAAGGSVHTDAVHAETKPRCRALLYARLALAALIPLARIRADDDGRAVFISKSELMCLSKLLLAAGSEDDHDRSSEGREHYREGDDVAEDSTSSLVWKESEDDDDYVLTAPFIYVNSTEVIDVSSSELEDRTASSTCTAISFDPIVSAIVVALRMFSHDCFDCLVRWDTTFDDRQTSRTTLDVDDTAGSVFRMLCLVALEGMISCGVFLPSRTLWQDVIDAIMEGRAIRGGAKNMSEEFLGTSHTISGLAGFAFAGITSSGSEAEDVRVENMDDTSYVDSLVQYLCDCWLSSESIVVANGCRGLGSTLCSVLPPSLRRGSLRAEEHCPLAQNCENQSSKLTQMSNWTDRICTRVLSQLHDLYGCEGNGRKEGVRSNSSVDDLALVPLISLLHDIFASLEEKLLLSPTQHHRVAVLCYRICSSPTAQTGRYCHLLALQCGALAMSRISPFQVERIRLQCEFESMNASESGGDQTFAHTFMDLCMRRSPSLGSLESKISSDRFARMQNLSVHEMLAKEAHDMDNFPVDEAMRDCGKAIGAWHCGDALLMIRIGAALYRGWVELTVRSPTSLIRRMVRLSGSISLADPDLASPKLGDVSTRQMGSPRVESPKRGETKTADLCDNNDGRKYCFFDDDSDAVRNAVALLDDLDSSCQLAGADVDTERDQSIVYPGINWDYDAIMSDTWECNYDIRRSVDAACDRLGAPSLSVFYSEGVVHSQRMDDLFLLGDIQRGPSFAWAESSERHGNDTQPIKRMHSADDIVLTDSRPHSKVIANDDLRAGSPGAKTVHQWLSSIYGEASQMIRDVEEQLREMSFSSKAIGTRAKRGQADIGSRDTGCRKLQFLFYGPRLERAVKILDRTSHLQTHKIALLFVGPGSGIGDDDASLSREQILLGAKHGSPSFLEFRKDLGELVPAEHLKCFSGGIDTSLHAADGDTALVWMSPNNAQRQNGLAVGATMIVYHDVTLMPPGLNQRKRHVGNDAVHIVYLEKETSIIAIGCDGNDVCGEETSTHGSVSATSISGEFGIVTIYVVPMCKIGYVKVLCCVRESSEGVTYSTLSHLVGSTIIPKGAAAAHYVRQLAIRADLACRTLMEDRIGLASNWEDRYIQIRQMNRYAKAAS